MRFYLLVNKTDVFVVDAFIYTWTTEPRHIDLFIEEYGPFQHDLFKVDLFECSNTHQFYDEVREEYGVSIDEYNELILMVSEKDPTVYHITTNAVTDELNEGGMTDQQIQSFQQGVIRSSINLLNLSRYIKCDDFNKCMKESILKFVSLYILVDDGIIPDSFSEGINERALKYMGIESIHDHPFHEGILSVVDYVMFTKICDGMEL